MNKKGSTHITLNDRLTIEKMLKVNSTRAKIAEAIGVCERSLYYELERGKCEQMTTDLEIVVRYCADVAERKYQGELAGQGAGPQTGERSQICKEG